MFPRRKVCSESRDLRSRTRMTVYFFVAGTSGPALAAQGEIRGELQARVPPSTLTTSRPRPPLDPAPLIVTLSGWVHTQSDSAGEKTANKLLTLGPPQCSHGLPPRFVGPADSH